MPDDDEWLIGAKDRVGQAIDQHVFEVLRQAQPAAHPEVVDAFKTLTVEEVRALLDLPPLPTPPPIGMGVEAMERWLAAE